MLTERITNAERFLRHARSRDLQSDELLNTLPIQSLLQRVQTRHQRPSQILLSENFPFFVRIGGGAGLPRHNKINLVENIQAIGGRFRKYPLEDYAGPPPTQTVRVPPLLRGI